MFTLDDFGKQISQLKNAKKFGDALAYFKKYKTDFSDAQITGDEYIVADMITCLRKTQIDAGFKFIEKYGIHIGAEQKERVLNAYGWLLWEKLAKENKIKNSHDGYDYFSDEEDIEQAKHFGFEKNDLAIKIEKFIPLILRFNTKYSKDVASMLFQATLKAEKTRNNPNWKFINDFCDMFDKNSLSRDCSTIRVERTGQLKDMELASDFETWYSYKTKALMKLGKWQECFDLSKEALGAIEKFHYSNDIWMSRRMTMAKKNLGNSADTIRELEKILRRKKEWFIQKELAELHFEEENSDKALEVATEAINAAGPLEFKVGLLYLLGKILKKQGEIELSFKHFSLSKLIRKEKEWSVPQNLLEVLRQFTEPEMPVSSIGGLKQELSKYKRIRVKPKNRKQGFTYSKLRSCWHIVMYNPRKGGQVGRKSIKKQ